MKLTLLLTAALLLAGCNLSQHAYLVDTIALLPAGDKITAESAVLQRFGSATQSTTNIIWRRRASEVRIVSIPGQGEHRLTDEGKILKINGDLKDCPTLYNSKTPTTLHIAPDGNHAWLTSQQGQVVASFDYEKAEATFGPANQPTWTTQ